MEELKRCPFCGGEAVVRKASMPYDGSNQAVSVICQDCGCRTMQFGTTNGDPRIAIAAWNRRADGWISVEDRLPDNNDTVEAYNPAFGAFDAYYYVGKWFTRGSKINVTHWRIPEPPKGE